MRRPHDVASAFMGKVLGDKRTRPVNETDAEKLVSTHELLKYAVALLYLDPDDDDEIWTVRRLAPMARYARATPYIDDGLLRWLAQHWASGALRGRPAVTWHTPNALTGRSRAETFAAEWNVLSSSADDSDERGMQPIIDDAEEVMKRSNSPLPTLYLGDPDWEIESQFPATTALLH